VTSWVSATAMDSPEPTTKSLACSTSPSDMKCGTELWGGVREAFEGGFDCSRVAGTAGGRRGLHGVAVIPPTIAFVHADTGCQSADVGRRCTRIEVERSLIP
jgi:hypothetical protein